jgi:microsomal dipeptidase-like Zn-dependent dipeptidase
MRKKILIFAALLLIVIALVFFLVLPVVADKRLNSVVVPPPYTASEKATTLHKQLLVVDLHADSLLWGRNLLERSSRGHIDVHRLIEGNVALQIFSVVTKTPRGLNIKSNDDKSDNITLLALSQRWPTSTWRSLKARALYQATRLHEMVAASEGKLVFIGSRSELSKYLEQRQRDQSITAGMLSIEGAHALDGEPSNVDALYAAGFRMIAPTHFFDNEFGGSMHGMNKGALTEKGKDMIRRMEAKNMIVDLAHASSQTIDDVLRISTRPVVVSHTGVIATCKNERNLTDDQLKAIARNGGLVGVGFWEEAICGYDAGSIAKAIRHIANLIGIDHVALGSDFDGAVRQPFDTTGLVYITEALLNQGFSESDIRLIMGGNTIQFLIANLPE